MEIIIMKKFLDRLSVKQIVIFGSILVVLVSYFAFKVEVEPTLHPQIHQTFETKDQELPVLQHEYIQLSTNVRLYWEAKPEYNYKGEVEWRQRLDLETWDPKWEMWSRGNTLPDVKEMKNQLSQIPGPRMEK
jgi:hypothetical protein